MTRVSDFLINGNDGDYDVKIVRKAGKLKSNDGLVWRVSFFSLGEKSVNERPIGNRNISIGEQVKVFVCNQRWND